MKIFLFVIYYLKLRLIVIFGLHRTLNPLNLKWRWKQWNRNYLAQHNRQAKSRVKKLQEISPKIVQKSLDKDQPTATGEFDNLIAEAAMHAIENLEEMHKNDIRKREKLRKGQAQQR